MNMYHTLVVSISFLSLSFIKPHVCIDIASKKVTGFSFKLVHRDSPESPLYPGRNLTFHEKLSRYSKATYARASYLSSKAATRNFTKNEPMIGRGLTHMDSFHYYMVLVNIGDPPVDLMLLFDTGSDFIWTQCLPCEKCYRQTGTSMYDSRKSRDFKYLPCTDGLCKDFLTCGSDNKCHYDLKYGSGAETKGVAMQDRFFFPPIDQAKVFPNLVMGCSNDNKGFIFEQSGTIGGILGMSTSPHSFPSQLSGVGGNGLELIDISVNDIKINFPTGTFAQRQYGAGGCFIDTGAPLSMIDEPAFNRFITEYEKAYLPTKIVRNTKEVPNPHLYCYYDKGIGVDQHPYVGFHFKNGASYWVTSKNLIHYDLHYFCLMILSGDRTIIGAWQQHGMRIIHDLRPGFNQLTFAFEDCDKEQATMAGSKF